MKSIKHILLTISMVLFMGISYAFNYQEYTQNYLNSVENTTVGKGICYDLIENLLKTVEDSLLVDIPHSIYGEPREINEVSIGDIIIYGNHIVVVYDVTEDGVIIADQNRVINGDTGVNVEFSLLNPSVLSTNNFQIYHPINLEDVPTYNELVNKGYNIKKAKRICLGLFKVSTNDSDKVYCSRYRNYHSGKDFNYCQLFFIDSELPYTDLEMEFYTTYIPNKTKIYHVIGRESTYNISDAWFIFTDDGIIVLDNVIEHYSEITRPIMKIVKK